MSRAQLEGDLENLRYKLHQMPPRPEGSPWALREYASALMIEHDTLAHATRSQQQVPDGMVFEGPAGDAFRENAQAAATEIGRLANAIHDVAKQVQAAANALEGQLRDWDSAHNGLERQIDQVKAQLRHAR